MGSPIYLSLNWAQQTTKGGADVNKLHTMG